MPRLRSALILAAAPLLCASSPPLADLPALIECRTDVTSYNALAFALTGADRQQTLRSLGLTKERSGNPMLEQYRLSAPIRVFGRTADRVAFNSAGIFAVLSEADPHPLAAQLGADPMIDAPNKFLAEKVVSETEEPLEGTDGAITVRVSLNVSTVDSRPGEVLAGCGYRVDMD